MKSSSTEIEEVLRGNDSKKILNLLGNLIVVLDKNARIVFLNKAGYKMLGYEPGELDRKNWVNKCVPKKNRDDVRKVFKKGISGKIKLVEAYENPALTKKGEERIMLWHNSVLKNKKGKIVGTFSSAKDITKSKKMEERARALINAAADPIIILDKRGKIERINEEFTKLMGYKPEDVAGKNLMNAKFITAKSKARVLKNFALRMAGKDVPLYEIDGVTKSGKIIPAEVNARAIVEDGKIIGNIAIVRDLTARKKAENELILSNKIRKDIIENAPLGIYIINDKGIVEYANPEICRISGIRREKFEGINTLTLPSYKKIELMKKIKDGLKGKSFIIGPIEYKSYFGKKITIRIFRGIPIKEGNLNKLLMIVEDLTKQKETEKNLKAKLRELEEFKKFAVGREMKMIELKKKIKKLEKRAKR